MVTVLCETCHQICPSSVASVRLSLQELFNTYLAHPVYLWPLPVVHLYVYPGWTQDDSYRKRRSGRTERGVRAYSPAWSELPTRN
ncbi:hypothetical protein B8042_24470 [Escherichia coli]|nr:hypothetical protein B8042_24470 [Escherichia coli]PQK43171.1 hypothetical protein C5Y86_25520 [Escherichia coli]HAJ1787291.1 hypothetical protein [Escherichia coli]HAJ6344912.1 hypothetical protein [Escherichia coli]